MSEEIPITKIPTQLHNLMWSDFPEEFVNDNYVKMLKNAHNEAEDAWKATYVGHQKVLEDRLNTPAANIRRSHEHAQRRRKAVEKTFHTAIRSAGEQITALEAAMNRVPKMPPEGVALRIADRLAALPDEKRVARINEAMKNGETDTIGAALFFSDSWLSGLSPERREIFRVQYREKTYPEMVQRKEAIEKAMNILVDGFNSYGRAVDKMFDLKELERTAKLAEEAEAALR